MTRFRRLTITHAAMIGGDAVMLVALADSLFLSIDPTAARSRVLLVLVVSFAPFLVIAPLIGPVIDRAAGGRRTVIQLVAVAFLRSVDGAALPWSLLLSTTEPSAAPNIVAQGDGGTITCRIFVDDELKDERTTDGLNAQTFCVVKSA